MAIGSAALVFANAPQRGGARMACLVFPTRSERIVRRATPMTPQTPDSGAEPGSARPASATAHENSDGGVWGKAYFRAAFAVGYAEIGEQAFPVPDTVAIALRCAV